MKLIIYCSRLIPQEMDINEILSDIRRKAKYNNHQQNITGLLIFENNHFIQALEGEDNQVEQLVDQIGKDPRHENMDILISKPIQHRQFKDWNMDTLNLDDQNIFNTDNIKKLRDAYQRNIDISDAMFVTLLKELFNHPDIHQVLNH